MAQPQFLCSDWICYRWFGVDISKTARGVIDRIPGAIIIKRNQVTIVVLQHTKINVSSMYNEYARCRNIC